MCDCIKDLLRGEGKAGSFSQTLALKTGGEVSGFWWMQGMCVQRGLALIPMFFQPQFSPRWPLNFVASPDELHPQGLASISDTFWPWNQAEITSSQPSTAPSPVSPTCLHLSYCAYYWVINFKAKLKTQILLQDILHYILILNSWSITTRSYCIVQGTIFNVLR